MRSLGPDTSSVMRLVNNKRKKFSILYLVKTEFASRLWGMVSDGLKVRPKRLWPPAPICPSTGGGPSQCPHHRARAPRFLPQYMWLPASSTHDSPLGMVYSMKSSDNQRNVTYCDITARTYKRRFYYDIVTCRCLVHLSRWRCFFTVRL